MSAVATKPFAVVTGASSGIGYELAKQFAEHGFEALVAGKDHVVASSFKNKVQSTVAHVLPDTTTAGIHRKQTEPGSGDKDKWAAEPQLN